MLRIVFSLLLLCVCALADVRVETIKEGDGPPVSKDKKYSAHVTLYRYHPEPAKIASHQGMPPETDRILPSGWSTRKEDGGNGKPFKFQPGVGLITGWTEGVLKMKVGEHAKIYVPPEWGYGNQEMGKPDGKWWIPKNSHLMFDIHILSEDGHHEL